MCITSCASRVDYIFCAFSPSRLRHAPRLCQGHESSPHNGPGWRQSWRLRGLRPMSALLTSRPYCWRIHPSSSSGLGRARTPPLAALCSSFLLRAENLPAARPLSKDSPCHLPFRCLGSNPRSSTGPGSPAIITPAFVACVSQSDWSVAQGQIKNRRCRVAERSRGA